jgi:hypothetical protein
VSAAKYPAIVGRIRAAVTMMTRRIVKPDGQETARAVLSLTGFSGIWEPDAANRYPAETRH